MPSQDDFERRRKQSFARVKKGTEHMLQNKQGFLWKKGKLFGKALKRWYHFEDGHLRYVVEAKDAGRATSKLVFPRALSSGRPYIVVGGSTTGGLAEAPYAFTVSHGTDSKEFFAETAEERDSWTDVLTNAVVRPINERYTLDLDNPLGSGAFATVVKGLDKRSGQPRAIKIISKQNYEDYEEMLDKELTILNLLGSHPHVIRLEEVFTTRRRVYVVMEFCSGGELVSRIGRKSGAYTERKAARVMYQVVSAVGYLHSKNVVHRDLKPENIIYSSPAEDADLKLIDFGMSSFFHESAEPAGTPEFMAPEVITQCELMYKNGYGPEVDLWALGIILFFLLTGRTPFEGGDMYAILDRVAETRWSFDPIVWKDISRDVQLLITKFIQKDPKSRISCANALHNEWLRGHIASDRELKRARSNVVRIVARQRFQKAIQKVLAANRFQFILRSSSSKDPAVAAMDDEDKHAAAALAARAALTVRRGRSATTDGGRRASQLNYADPSVEPKQLARSRAQSHDPRKRRKSVISGSVAKTGDGAIVGIEELLKYKARRKFKRGVNALIATNRLAALVSSFRGDEATV